MTLIVKTLSPTHHPLPSPSPKYCRVPPSTNKPTWIFAKTRTRKPPTQCSAAYHPPSSMLHTHQRTPLRSPPKYRFSTAHNQLTRWAAGMSVGRPLFQWTNDIDFHPVRLGCIIIIVGGGSSTGGMAVVKLSERPTRREWELVAVITPSCNIYCAEERRGQRCTFKGLAKSSIPNIAWPSLGQRTSTGQRKLHIHSSFPAAVSVASRHSFTRGPPSNKQEIPSPTKVE